MKRVIIYLIVILLFSHSLTFAEVSEQDAKKLGMVIWNNEADKRVDLLAYWGSYSSFPEIGIGHYIWYPQGQTGPYTAQFPPLCAYLQECGVHFPQWLLEAYLAGGAPWQTREEFMYDTQRTNELRQFLAATVDLQTQFMIKRLEDEWKDILATAPSEHRAQMQLYFDLMRSSLLGTYALVDYLNFKGNGLNPREERNGHRFGLLQVMLDMPDGLTAENVTKAFAICAARRLVNYIGHFGPEYRPVKFLAGWVKRVSTYARTNIFDSVKRDWLEHDGQNALCAHCFY
jgi:hypothetical protein